MKNKSSKQANIFVSEEEKTLNWTDIQSNFKNTFGLSKSGTSRMVTNYKNREHTYEGFKNMLSYLGEYNFNLDNRIVYGSDIEFFKAKYPTDPSKAKAINDRFILHCSAFGYIPYINLLNQVFI